MAKIYEKIYDNFEKMTSEERLLDLHKRLVGLSTEFREHRNEVQRLLAAPPIPDTNQGS